MQIIICFELGGWLHSICMTVSIANESLTMTEWYAEMPSVVNDVYSL